MKVSWGTCGGTSIWCGFHTVDLGHPTFNKEGVYIIWERGGRIFKIGKGQLRTKIAEDRKNPLLSSNSKLCITWAPLEAKDRSGVEKYLVEKLLPQLPSELTNASAVEVNLPWPY